MSNPITEFTVSTVKQLHADVDEALRLVAEKHGLNYHGKSVRFSDTECPIGGVFGLKAVGGVPVEQVEFNRYCGLFQLEKGDFGAVITINREQWKLVGVLPSRPKFGYRFQNVATGKVSLFTDAVVPRIVAVRKPAVAA